MRVTGTNLNAVQNAKILFKYPFENGAVSNTTVQVRSSVLYHHIRAVYTRENKPRLTIAAANIRREHPV